MGRAVACLLVGGIAVVGCAPTLRWLGYLSPALGKREVTTEWRVVNIAGDRRSAVIRVNVCPTPYAGTEVTRVGRDVRLTVFDHAVSDDSKVDCASFASMPIQVVRFGFALPTGGRVLDSGCPPTECTGSAQVTASAP